MITTHSYGHGVMLQNWWSIIEKLNSYHMSNMRTHGNCTYRDENHAININTYTSSYMHGDNSIERDTDMGLISNGYEWIGYHYKTEAKCSLSNHIEKKSHICQMWHIHNEHATNHVSMWQYKVNWRLSLRLWSRCHDSHDRRYNIPFIYFETNRETRKANIPESSPVAE